jgi:peptidoglycan/xylan/chitin deacetylase (PgdA/CDA1 family)
VTTRPAGTTSSASFNFDIDAEEAWLADDPNANKHPVMLSQGHYGPRVGVPAILQLLEQHEVTASFFIPGRVAENYPATVESVLTAGHELAHHGYTHRSPAGLTFDEEVEEFERSVAALRVFGVEPNGYRAPAWDCSVHTLGLAERFGFRYSSNYMSDIRPFLHEGTDLIELPVHWVLDDAAHFWFGGDDTWTKKISTNGEVDAIFSAEARGIAKMGGTTIYTFHPQVIGRPGRLELLDKTLARATADREIWVATTADIAADAREQLT